MSLSMTPDHGRLDRIVADARKAAEKREMDYRDHNHNNNPADGSNWELLCLYCHNNEHQRQSSPKNLKT